MSKSNLETPPESNHVAWKLREGCFCLNEMEEFRCSSSFALLSKKNPKPREIFPEPSSSIIFGAITIGGRFHLNEVNMDEDYTAPLPEISLVTADQPVAVSQSRTSV
nr:hypothetical protein Iba_scaffold14897CG0650 [Ipomoea batatas]